MRTDSRIKLPFAGTGEKIVLLVFGIIGIVFLTIGGFSFAYREREEALDTLGIVFTTIGSLLLLVCVIILIIASERNKKLKRIIENGYYIVAEIGNIMQNYNVCINGRYPYIITANYQDTTGCIHTFRSRNIFYDPTGIMTNNMVKIYTRPDNYRLYYMDINEILPKVKMH